MPESLTIRELGRRLQERNGLVQEPQEEIPPPVKLTGRQQEKRDPHFIQRKYLSTWKHDKIKIRIVGPHEVVEGIIQGFDMFTVFFLATDGRKILFHKNGILRYEECASQEV